VRLVIALEVVNCGIRRRSLQAVKEAIGCAAVLLVRLWDLVRVVALVRGECATAIEMVPE
jgi:hypothetical protein